MSSIPASMPETAPGVVLPHPASPILAVDGLRVSYPGRRGPVDAVRDVSFTVGREKVGIVGESGSGKSTIGRALLRLLPTARVTARSLTFSGLDLLSLGERDMLGIRGRRISMILQDPKYSLNPIKRVGDQVAEAYRVHHRVAGAEARRRAVEMLDAVRIRDPEKSYALYPHEVSGGMGQRIMIAMMLIPEPDLVIADEPTSALDVTVRLQVLSILDDLVTRRGIGLVFISHDLNLVRAFCDRVLIMYAGRIVESIDARRLSEAQHPYSRGLLAAQPRIGGPRLPLPVLRRDPAWRLDP
jgi:peptide/nickel transport system ATP-binding protein